MKFPWSNLAILLCLSLLAVSGFFGLKAGGFEQRWLLWLHGGAAYTLLILFIWKGVVIGDAWRRKKRWTRARLGFAFNLLLIVVTLGLGLGWTFGGLRSWGGFTWLSLHIYVAVPVLLLTGWHAWRMRFVLRLKATTDRRLFLGSSLAALLGAGAWTLGKQVQPQLNPAAIEQRFTGSYRWPTAVGFPVTSWIADNPPPIDPATWRLSLSGAVATPQVWTLAELEGLAAPPLAALLDCTSGWYTEQAWRGVPLQVLLERAGVRPTAVSLTVRAVSSYQRRFPLAEAQSFLLALDVAGSPLSHGHGFPLRLVAPGRRGFEWVKWVTQLEVNTTPAWLQLPLPLQ